jgi:hypothetical protein
MYPLAALSNRGATISGASTLRSVTGLPIICRQKFQYSFSHQDAPLQQGEQLAPVS